MHKNGSGVWPSPSHTAYTSSVERSGLSFVMVSVQEVLLETPSRHTGSRGDTSELKAPDAVKPSSQLRSHSNPGSTVGSAPPELVIARKYSLPIYRASVLLGSITPAVI